MDNIVPFPEPKGLNMSSLYLTLKQDQYWRRLAPVQKTIVQTSGELLRTGQDCSWHGIKCFKSMDLILKDLKK